MADPLARLATRAAYAATQLPRMAWYAGHGLLMRRLAAAARERDGAPPPAPANGPVPDQRRLYADMAALLMRDLANVEAGIYPLPADHDGTLPTLIRRSRLFFSDLPEIYERRTRRGTHDVRSQAARGTLPDYFLQNFHFQSDGWLTEDSANRYDTQVEVLFRGTGNAMRRQALPLLHAHFAGRDQRRLRLLDVGCGTGRFLDFVKQAWPRLPVVGLDLSNAYLRHARRHLARWARLGFVVANAEAIPARSASFDAVTSIFLMHELPPEVRRRVIGECARVLAPGGALILIDSLQRGDRPDYEGLLDWFPAHYHEPYYASYVEEDFAGIARGFGLSQRHEEPAFLSKVMLFAKE